MSENKENTPGLKKNTLLPWHVAILGMVAIGPAAGVGLNFGFIATFSGKAIALVFVYSVLVMLLTANTLRQLTKKLVNAGSSYAFVTEGLGTKIGFIVGWIYILSYFLFAAGGFTVFGGWAEAYIESILNIEIHWMIFTLLALAVVAFFSYLGISPSLKLSAVVVFIGMGLILALSLWVVFSGGANINTIEPFRISSSPTGLNGIGLAMVFGILSMIGFETAATYSEELKDSRKNMGKSLYMALLIPGLFFIIVGYAMAVGYPDFSKIAEDATPLQTLAETYWGKMGVFIVVIAILTSIFGFAMGAFNAFIRVIYSLGRTGLFPSALGKVHPKNGTPYVAIFAGALITIIFVIPFSLYIGPFNAWGYFGFFISLGLLIVYIMTHVSVYVLYKKRFTDEYSQLKHAIMPGLGSLILLFPIWNTIFPLPPMPYAMFPFLMIGWIVIGVILVFVIDTKKADAIIEATEIEEEK